MKSPKVMIVGSASSSKGGVASVINLLKTSKLWNQYQCYWLETQIQDNLLIKLIFCLRSYFLSIFKIPLYDIIHFHTVPGRSLLIQFPVFLLSLIYRKKIILHFHAGNQFDDYANSKLFKFCLKQSNYIILLSNSLKNKLTSLFPDVKTEMSVIYNPCLDPETLPYNERSKTIIFSGKLNHNKGYDILLKAFSLIYRDYPEWKLIFMGDGEINKAASLAKELEINSKTRFMGYTVGKVKDTIYKNASILCLCSYKEGLPMAVIEAWSYGIPVITTLAGGLSEIIIENKNAITFNFGNYQELSQKLKYLIDDYSIREKMSKFSRKFALENFSITQVTVQISHIYNYLINNKL